ncbi:MAG: hypothetical protein HWE13_03040 [Gammaproteobacteria bacterium]|nr:hypothetical protein [Gammaproteobacteria bacterium]NVK87072.1 hypothetical protein [Gammaproteobacteria bacterium]
MNKTPQAFFTDMNGERCYVGPERRIDRRRTNNNRRLEHLLSDFGLDRRIGRDRRKRNTSWLIMSQAANS